MVNEASGRTLLVMRHAKSDWNSVSGSDHDRPLAERGIRSARTMGRLLTDLNIAPDHVISSTALRARTTAELAAEAGGWRGSIQLDGRLYGGSPSDVLAVAALAPDVKRLMLVGHQPTWAGVVELLTGDAVDMRTATVAVVEMATDWTSLPDASARLVAVHQPRDHLSP